MKRTLDDLDDLDDFDDFDETDDEQELIEPQPKRLRNKSPIAKEEGPTEKHGQTSGEESYRLIQLEATGFQESTIHRPATVSIREPPSICSPAVLWTYTGPTYYHS